MAIKYNNNPNPTKISYIDTNGSNKYVKVVKYNGTTVWSLPLHITARPTNGKLTITRSRGVDSEPTSPASETLLSDVSTTTTSPSDMYFGDSLTVTAVPSNIPGYNYTLQTHSISVGGGYAAQVGEWTSGTAFTFNFAPTYYITDVYINLSYSTSYKGWVAFPYEINNTTLTAGTVVQCKNDANEGWMSTNYDKIAWYSPTGQTPYNYWVISIPTVFASVGVWWYDSQGEYHESWDYKENYSFNFNWTRLWGNSSVVYSDECVVGVRIDCSDVPYFSPEVEAGIKAGSYEYRTKVGEEYAYWYHIQFLVDWATTQSDIEDQLAEAAYEDEWQDWGVNEFSFFIGNHQYEEPPYILLNTTN